MAEIVKLINSIDGWTLTRDVDFSLLNKSITNPWVVEWLIPTQAGGAGTDITVWTGEAFVKVTRTSVTPNEVFYVVFRNTVEKVLTVWNNKKIFIEIETANINNPTNNTSPTGENIWSIKIDDNYPSDNFLKLGETDWSGLLNILSKEDLNIKWIWPTITNKTILEDVNIWDAIGYSQIWINSTEILSSNNPDYIQTIKVSDNKIVSAYIWLSWFWTARVWTISWNTITWWGETTFESAVCSSVRISLIDTDKVFIAYVDEWNSDAVTGVVWDISWNVIAFWTAVSSWLTNSNSNIYYIWLSKANTNKVFVASQNFWNGRWIVATISWNTITWWASLQYVASNQQYASCVYISDDKCLLLYRLSWSWIKAIVVSISWTVPSYWTIFSTSWLFQTSVEWVLIDTDKVAIIKNNTSTNWVSILTISWTNISEWTVLSLWNWWNNQFNLWIEKVSETSFIAWYWHSAQVFNVSWTDIIWTWETLIDTMTDKSFALYDTDKVSMIYKSSWTDGNTNLLNIQPWYRLATSNWIFIWFAKETVSSWNQLNILTSWIENNQAWLSIWDLYYIWQVNWTISMSGTVLVWKAISESELIINNGF